MRIVVIFSDDIIFKPRLLYSLLLHRSKDICCVIENSQARSKKNKIKSIRFWGIKGFFFLGIHQSVKKIAALLPLPSFVRCLLNINNVCKSFGIPYRFVTDINNSDFLNYLDTLQPDIILSFQHQLFKKRILNLPKIACLNCHPAKLPAYRGVKPLFWAMLDDTDSIGVTVHTMDEKFDCGFIISQMTFSLNKRHSLMQNYISAYELSLHVILDALDKIEHMPIQDFKVISPKSPYYRFPSKEDIKKFKEQGNSII